MQILTGKLFKEMVLCGANTLHNNHPEIDALNVFPVPDGDTGTNMSMTFNAGAAEIKDMDSGYSMPFSHTNEEASIATVTHEYGHMLQNVIKKDYMESLGWKNSDMLAFCK